MNQTLELSQSFGEQEVESINLVCKLVSILLLRLALF